MPDQASFRPGEVWLDTNEKPIQAHGGGVLYDRGMYYWFGENKDTDTQKDVSRNDYRADVVGVSCYSSRDLYHWKYEGLALPANDDPASDLHPAKVVERPKVIYNARTRKYVMWMHIDSRDYQYAAAGVAVSDNPVGPYHYLGSMRPNGAESRDMTVFQDEDGAAYLIHSSEQNKTMYIARLTDDYLAPNGEYARAFVNEQREAPAVFKHHRKYYIITSYCTGWHPNPAMYAVSDSMMEKWEVLGNPCIGNTEQAETTFNSQSTFILPITGRPGSFIFMADRWNFADLRDSRYVWLPLEAKNGRVEINWCGEWSI